MKRFIVVGSIAALLSIAPAFEAGAAPPGPAQHVCAVRGTWRSDNHVRPTLWQVQFSANGACGVANLVPVATVSLRGSQFEDCRGCGQPGQGSPLDIPSELFLGVTSTTPVSSAVRKGGQFWEFQPGTRSGNTTIAAFDIYEGGFGPQGVPIRGERIGSGAMVLYGAGYRCGGTNCSYDIYNRSITVVFAARVP